MARAIDPVKNFAEVIPVGLYNAAAVSITLTTGDGGKLPETSEGQFNLVWYNSTDYSGPASDPQREIVRVVSRVVDSITVLRGQEGTVASNKNIAGKVYKMALGVTKRLIDEINDDLEVLAELVDNIGPDGFPSQTGHAGEYLTTDGTNLSWVEPNGLPDQTGHAGEFLTTDGTDASWVELDAVTAGANVGIGTGTIFRNITGGDTINFKTLRAGANITLTNGADDIIITATGGGGGGGTATDFQSLPSDPGSPANGEVWYNSTTNLFKFYQNGAVVTLGDGGDVTEAGNNAFTGDNTHAGSETFSDVVDLSAATITFPSLITYVEDITFTSTSVLTHNASSNEVYANESVISNQADETFGSGYEGTYADNSIIGNEATETFGAGYSGTYVAGSSVDFTNATVTGLSVQALDTYKAYNGSGSLQVTSITILSDTELYFIENTGTVIKKLDITTGAVTTLGSIGATITGGRIVSDSAGNAYVTTYSGAGNLVKCTPAGVVTTIHTGTPGFNLQIRGIDFNDNVYFNEEGGSGLKKITPGGVVSNITLTGSSINQGYTVIGKSLTETYVVAASATPTALLYSLDNYGVSTNLPISPLNTSTAPTSAYILPSGNIGFNMGNNFMEVTYTGTTIYNSKMVDITTKCDCVESGIIYGVSSAGSYIEYTPATDSYSLGASIFYVVVTTHRVFGTTKKVFVPSSSNSRIMIK